MARALRRLGSLQASWAWPRMCWCSSGRVLNQFQVSILNLMLIAEQASLGRETKQRGKSQILAKAQDSYFLTAMARNLAYFVAVLTVPFPLAWVLESERGGRGRRWKVEPRAGRRRRDLDDGVAGERLALFGSADGALQGDDLRLLRLLLRLPQGEVGEAGLQAGRHGLVALLRVDSRVLNFPSLRGAQ